MSFYLPEFTKDYFSNYTVISSRVEGSYGYLEIELGGDLDDVLR